MRLPLYHSLSFQMRHAAFFCVVLSALSAAPVFADQDQVAKQAAYGLTSGQIEALTDTIAEMAQDPGQVAQALRGLENTPKGRYALGALAYTQKGFQGLTEGAVALDPQPLMGYRAMGMAEFANALDAAQIGASYLIHEAHKKGSAPDQIRYLSPADLAPYLTPDYTARVTAAAQDTFGANAVVQILPVASGDQPALQIGFAQTPKQAGLGVLRPSDGGLQQDWPQDLQHLAAFRRNNISTLKSTGPGAVAPGQIDFPKGTNSDIAVLDRFALNTAGANRERAADKAKAQKQSAHAHQMSAPGCGEGTARPCFMAAVSLHNDGAVQCSGVLVAPSWVLTAAHCACNGAPAWASIGQVTPDRFGRAILKASFVGEADAGPTPTATVPITSTRFIFDDLTQEGAKQAFCTARRSWKRMPTPPPDQLELASMIDTDIAPETQNWLLARNATFGTRDLALLKLARPLQLEGQDPRIALADAQEYRAASQLWIAGFGRNNHERFGGHKTILHDGMIAMKCETPLQQKQTGCMRDIEMLFVDAEAKSDSCQGDSGAGIFALIPGKPPSLVAIVSRGVDGSGCGPGGINVLTTSQKVRDWITKITAS